MIDLTTTNAPYTATIRTRKGGRITATVAARDYAAAEAAARKAMRDTDARYACIARRGDVTGEIFRG